jgi:hypothetical protein
VYRENLLPRPMIHTRFSFESYVLLEKELVGRESSVYISSLYGLDGPGIESAPVKTSPRAQPASYTMGTGSSSGV